MLMANILYKEVKKTEVILMKKSVLAFILMVGIFGGWNWWEITDTQIMDKNNVSHVYYDKVTFRDGTETLRGDEMFYIANDFNISQVQIITQKNFFGKQRKIAKGLLQ